MSGEMGTPDPLHPYDAEIRRLRTDERLTYVQIIERLGITPTALKRAIRREHIGAEAERQETRSQKRQWAKRKRERDRKAQNRRTADRERARAWAAQHPEEQRARAKAWAEEHPERRREIEKASYERNKEHYRNRQRAWEDQHAEERRANGAQYRRETKDHRAQLQRDYRADPAKYAELLQANRDRRRLIRRLEAAGLPPKTTHCTTAAERRADDAAATEFFTRQRSVRERQRIKDEYTPTPPELLKQWEVRSQLARARMRELQSIKTYLRRHGSQLRDDVTLDSRARVARGAAPLDVRREMFLRAQQAVRRAQAMNRGPQSGTHPGTGIPHAASLN